MRMQSLTTSKKKGVTLIEVMVSLFILVLAVTVMMGIFGDLLRKRADLRDAQQRTEEYSLAMSYMAKKMRTSDYVSGCGVSTTNSCRVKEHSTNADIVYTFENSGPYKGSLTETIGGNKTEVVKNVEGSFAVKNTGASGVPLISVRMNEIPNKYETSVQTTVSLRSY